jgi:hypothetical protein
MDAQRLGGIHTHRLLLGGPSQFQTHSYWGEVARGIISADKSDQYDAWLRIQIGDSIQRITLVSRSRHFGGRQWLIVPAKANLR